MKKNSHMRTGDKQFFEVGPKRQLWITDVNLSMICLVFNN